MSRNKMSLDFDGFIQLSEKLMKLGGDLERTTEKALKKSFDAVTPGIESAITPHKLTGKTQSTLRKDGTVKWDGSVAEVPVGFDISGGGLPSIFLMYGTPHMKPDRKLYNSIYGAKTRKKVKELQAETFSEELGKVLK